jgi:DMSO/TMAO reductase YedYZ molybdopterin-dependent catalytic subunit
VHWRPALGRVYRLDPVLAVLPGDQVIVIPRLTDSVPSWQRAGRRTNLALLGLLTLAIGTGVLAFAVGTPLPSALVAYAHGAAGLGLLLLIPWKAVIAQRGWRRQTAHRWARRALGIALTAVVLGTILSGVLETWGGYRDYFGVTANQVHVGLALVGVPLLLAHLIRHRPRPRRVDLSRRLALRTGSLAVGSAAAYVAFEAAGRVLNLPAGPATATGSTEAGTDAPDQMPIVTWLLDPVPEVAASWQLEIVAAGRTKRWALSELTAFGDTVRATLDCTGGWYATQDWTGVRLDRLIPPGAVGSLRITSVTGYDRLLPASQASKLWLATDVGGQPLSPGHGAPVRLVAPGRRGFWWVKWVARVELVDLPWWLQSPFPTQ